MICPVNWSYCLVRQYELKRQAEHYRLFCKVRRSKQVAKKIHNEVELNDYG